MSKTVVWSSTKVVMQVAKRIPQWQRLPSRELALRTLSLALENLSDTDQYQFDYVVDAGISNIIAFSEKVSTKSKPSGEWAYVPQTLRYDVKTDSGSMAGAHIEGRLVYWRHVCDLFIEFCKRRQDCLAILDTPRPLTLKGNVKMVRKTNQAATFYEEIGQRLKYLPVPNSMFATMFFNWWNPTSMENVGEKWLPPSIIAAEIYCRTPFWKAPAGLNNGLVPEIADLSVNPSKKQQSLIYNARMNYFVMERGICRIEGQKTTQIKPTAFDRVSTRRLFNFLNRSVGRIMKYFVYEPNNRYTRSRIVDTLEVLMDRIVSLEAAYDYRVVCDESTNPPDVIDRNELRMILMVKPMKHAEFIKASFVATRTDADLALVTAGLEMTGALNWS